MNKKDAKELSKTVTNQQLLEMLENAKNQIVDWNVRSSVNKSLNKGAAWNILAKDFDVNRNHHQLTKQNLIREFGDYLPERYKPIKENKKEIPIKFYQEPDFSNWQN